MATTAAATGGTTPRAKKPSSVSTSAPTRASRSPLRCRCSPLGARGSTAAKNHARSPPSTRRVTRCVR